MRRGSSEVSKGKSPMSENSAATTSSPKPRGRKCKCDAPTVLLTVKRGVNKGRLFWRCPNWMQALHNLRGFCSSTQVESATEALSALFSTLSMTIEIVLRIHSLIFYAVVSFQQKIIDVQRKQDERIENLEEDNGSFKAMLKEMQEQTREMKRHTVETRQADALAREVMKEAYDKQINMLQEALSAIVERKAV